jgi:hypothetical protein
VNVKGAAVHPSFTKSGASLPRHKPTTLREAAMIIAFPSPQPELQAIGRRLRDLRLARGIGLEGLAASLRISPHDLETAERGRLRLTSVQLYAATLCLHIPMRLLFEDSRPLSQRH